MKFKILPKILPAFITLGVSSLLMQGMISQGELYHQYLVSPTDNIESHVMFFDKEVQQRKAEKEKYLLWAQENVQLVTSLKSKDVSIKEKIEDLPIILKDSHSLWDKVTLFVQKNLALIDEKYVNENTIMIADGQATQLQRFFDTTNGEVVGKGLYIGLKSINNQDSRFFNNLRKAFKNNEQQMYDYIFFHELSHYISFEMQGNEGKNHEQITEQIIDKFNKTQGIKGFKHNDQDKGLILEQYGEAMADILAIQLLYKKYPELKKDDTLPLELAKVRAKNYKDFGHMNTIALTSFQDMRKNTLPDSLEGMLSIARDKGLENTQFNSTRTFATYGKKIPEQRFTEVKLINKFDTLQAIKNTKILHLDALEDLKNQKKM